jgi:hypothetical protein
VRNLLAQVRFERRPEARPARCADILDQAATGRDLAGCEAAELAEAQPVLRIGGSVADPGVLMIAATVGGDDGQVGEAAQRAGQFSGVA